MPRASWNWTEIRTILTGHTYAEFYRTNPSMPSEGVTAQRLFAAMPSIVRKEWSDRFSVYIGGGRGLKHQDRLVSERTNAAGNKMLARAADYVDSRDTVAPTLLFLRGGALVNLAPVWSGGWASRASSPVSIRSFPACLKWAPDIVSGVSGQAARASGSQSIC